MICGIPYILTEILNDCNSILLTTTIIQQIANVFRLLGKLRHRNAIKELNYVKRNIKMLLKRCYLSCLGKKLQYVHYNIKKYI